MNKQWQRNLFNNFKICDVNFQKNEETKWFWNFILLLVKIAYFNLVIYNLLMYKCKNIYIYIY